MKYGYCRVSTIKQGRDGNSLEQQEQALRAAGAEKIYCDTYTGTKIHRPKLDRMLFEIQSGDILIVTKLDRIARSAVAGVELIDGLLKKGVTVHILNMGILDDSPAGRLIMTIMLAFAQFERDMIVERTMDGKAIARNNPGYRDGRPQKFSEQKLNHALELLKNHSYNQVENLTGISKSTLIRYNKKVRDSL